MQHYTALTDQFKISISLNFSLQSRRSSLRNPTTMLLYRLPIITRHSVMHKFHLYFLFRTSTKQGLFDQFHLIVWLMNYRFMFLFEIFWFYLDNCLLSFLTSAKTIRGILFRFLIGLGSKGDRFRFILISLFISYVRYDNRILVTLI